MRYSSSYSSSQNRFPSVSIIIPALNEEEHIRDLLEDIQKQTLQPKEIILVDAKSKDNTVIYAKAFPNVSILSLAPNPAAQRTAGGKKAKGDFLIFLDADVRLDKNFIHNVMQLQKQKNFSVACPFYVPYKSSKLITSVYYFFDSLFYLLQKLLPSGAGSCIIASRQAFSAVGGFDKTLRYDDIAFIRSAGRKYKFSYLPQKVFVSDRRFRHDGIVQTVLLYFVLSIFFLFGQFKLANIIKYKFNHYK